MEYRKFDRYIVLRIDRKEELIATLKEVIRSEKIGFAKVSGIGSVCKTTLAFYQPQPHEYRTNYFPGNYDITSLAGNVMLDKEGKTRINIHATISDRGLHVYGGFLQKAEISDTCEVILEVIPAELSQSCHPENKSNYLKFD